MYKSSFRLHFDTYVCMNLTICFMVHTALLVIPLDFKIVYLF